ncbi:MAG TPA: aminotransferase class I/II-fold pyridoxal phosphate-dependent enzyme, partial [Candidatus Ventrisoma faecale]|nr:aminotransferase class I/II-fold pyridoxal phosphate-dependent enzyme [Candidatus Ventrisoma faecale]
MLSEKMMKLGKKRSVIRELFEYGNRRKAEIGAENVFDFSLGNPSVNPPACVKETIKRLLETEDDIALHGYTSAQGDAKVRAAVADYINRSFGRHLTGGHIYMTVGAAASLTISLKAMAVEGDEFITFSPFFPEYRVFVENAGGTLKVVPCNTEDFQIDRELFGQAITPGTKAVILNSPNNPSGVVLSEETVKGICEVMEKKQAEYGHAIYLITDEPYRELVYDDNIQVPYLMNYYKNTL